MTFLGKNVDDINDKKVKTVVVKSDHILPNSIRYKTIESTRYREEAEKFKIACDSIKIPVEDVDNELNTIMSYDKVSEDSKDELMQTIATGVRKMQEANKTIEDELINVPDLIRKKAEALDEKEKRYECTIPKKDDYV